MLGEDVSRAVGKGGWVCEQREKRYPFHEYSSQAHDYLKVGFANPKLMNAFIDRFNSLDSQINASNSYLSDDEFGNTYIYKLARESDISLCDWCEVKF
jgi:hypothetical protein